MERALSSRYTWGRLFSSDDLRVFEINTVNIYSESYLKLVVTGVLVIDVDIR